MRICYHSGHLSLFYLNTIILSQLISVILSDGKRTISSPRYVTRTTAGHSQLADRAVNIDSLPQHGFRAVLNWEPGVGVHISDTKNRETPNWTWIFMTSYLRCSLKAGLLNSQKLVPDAKTDSIYEFFQVSGFCLKLEVPRRSLCRVKVPALSLLWHGFDP